MTDAASQLDCRLIGTTDGLERYDVVGHPIVSQLVVPVGIKEGGEFQMTYGQGQTAAVNWAGSLEQSVEAWIDDHIRARF